MVRWVTEVEQEDSLARSEQVLRMKEGQTFEPNRLVCGVMIDLKEHQAFQDRIMQTWGPACDELVWLDGGNEKTTWKRTQHAWIQLETEYIGTAEWFVVCAHDTILYPQRIRDYLARMNPYVARYLGHKLYYRQDEGLEFHSGFAYVLSKEAVRRLAPRFRTLQQWDGVQPRDSCVDHDLDGGSVVNLSECLREVRVLPEPTTDTEGRERFLPFQIADHRRLARSDDSWFWSEKPRSVGAAADCCVPRPLAAGRYPIGSPITADDE